MILIINNNKYININICFTLASMIIYQKFIKYKKFYELRKTTTTTTKRYLSKCIILTTIIII